MNETLFLIDTSSYLFRAFYALPYLSNSKGLPTNAILGFTNMLLKIIREHKPDYIATVLDSKEPTFRDKIFAEYKALRPPAPDELKIQIPHVLELIKALGIKTVEKSGFEADDLIATVVEQTKNSGVKIVIVTGDKDMYQLVSDNVFILDTMKDVIVTPEEVEKKFGVSPSQIAELLALTGDSTDNIPGIRGVGIKTAQKLLKEYGNIENILKNVNEIKQESLRQTLVESEEQLKVNKLLVNLDKKIDIQFNLKDYKQEGIDRNALKKLFLEYEFFRLLKEFGLEEERRIEYNFLANNQESSSFINEIESKEVGLVIAQDIIAIALSNSSATAFNFNEDAFKAILNNAQKIYLFDAKEVLKLLKGLELPYEKIFDVKLIAYLLNPNYPPHDLNTIIIRELGSSINKVEEATSPLFSTSDRDKKAMSEACAIYEVGKILHQKLSTENLEKLYLEIELPLVEVLHKMESHGILVDKNKLKDFESKLDRKILSLEREIFALAGEEFNIESPKQLQKILFEKLNLPHKKRTKTGFSTDSEVLEQLTTVHPLPAKLLEYRSLAKTRNTYVHPLIESINPVTGRIHPTFHQDIVATGRLSCSNPNLQNIPAIGELAEELRGCFIAEKNKQFISADYSQIELRLLAHFSKDATLLKSFNEGKDIHTATAAVLFNVRESEVTAEMRRKAKVINFGIIYGMSPHGLSQELKISYEEADEYIQEYFVKYPTVKKFIDGVIESARKNRFVTTLFGRKRPVPDILSPHESIRSAAERIAVNSIMQGSAADIIKIAMLQIYHKIKQDKLDAHLLIQIHDELVLEVSEESIYVVEKIVADAMENCVRISVPLKVELKHGRSLAELKI
jgi:DNA polymerase-1